MQGNLISQNLRLLRTNKRMTQSEVAIAANLSEAGYKKIESGKVKEPQYSTLKALSRALEVKIEELFQPVPTLRFVRFRSSGQLKNRNQIIVRVGRWLDGYNQLERELGKKEAYILSPNKPRPKSKKKRYVWAQEQALEIRRQVGLDAHSSIRDIRGLLEKQGIKVYSFSLANPNFFGLSIAEKEGGPAIAVNTWERISVERWIFTAAHELAHLILHKKDYDIEEEEEEEDHEYEANVFASRFLMPSEAFQNEWNKTSGNHFVDRVLKLKNMFSVSYKTVLWRLVEEGFMDEKAWGRFRTEYSARHNKKLEKSEEPEALSANAFQASIPESSSGREPFGLQKFDFLGSRLQGLVKEALEKGVITWLHAAQLLELSLDEMRNLAGEWGEL